MLMSSKTTTNVFSNYALKLKITIKGGKTITITLAKTTTSSNAFKNEASFTKWSVNRHGRWFLLADTVRPYTYNKIKDLFGTKVHGF